MEKTTHSLNKCTVLCLTISILLNVLSTNHFLRSRLEQKSWTKEAAAEAEAVASLTCSGHGRAFLDGLTVDGNPICECNACYGGLDCSQLLPDCVVDADSGDPMFLEPYWMQHAASSAMVVAGWHRMSYEFNDGSLISQELKSHIMKLHATVGNAVTDRRFIVFGAGATQLLNAAVHALSSLDYLSDSPSLVVASTPYYPVYKEQTQFFRSEDYEFLGDTHTLVWNESISYSKVKFIEFVTSPNNPDGKLKKAVLKGKNVKQIHDLAYYWPHFTPIPAPADEDLMIFTLSKLTGHAGSRFGWALVKDEAVYNRMMEYISLSTYGVPKETQVRTLKLLKVVLQGKAKEFFYFGSQTMKNRWEKLSETFSMSKRFSIQEIEPQHCSFFQKNRIPSSAFAWVTCEREEDKDCHEVLRTANIIGREGRLFGDDNRHVRLSLVKSEDDFELLLQRIGKLVSEENHSKTMEAETATWSPNINVSTSSMLFEERLSNQYLQHIFRSLL